MSSNQTGFGLALVRIAIGIFLLSEGLGKLGWFFSSSELARTLAGWAKSAGPASRWYLDTIAFPGVRLFARLVPTGELLSGAALVVGFWPRLAAAAALLMVLNFHVASGAIFQFGFLTNGYGLPVVGSLLGLAVGGARLPWSIRR